MRLLGRLGRALSAFNADLGHYSKFIVAILGAASVGLTTFAGNAPWQPTVLAALSALSVYLVSNAPRLAAKAAAAPAPADETQPLVKHVGAV